MMSLYSKHTLSKIVQRALDEHGIDSSERYGLPDTDWFRVLILYRGDKYLEVYAKPVENYFNGYPHDLLHTQYEYSLGYRLGNGIQKFTINTIGKMISN